MGRDDPWGTFYFYSWKSSAYYSCTFINCTAGSVRLESKGFSPNRPNKISILSIRTAILLMVSDATCGYTKCFSSSLLVYILGNTSASLNYWIYLNCASIKETWEKGSPSELSEFKVPGWNEDLHVIRKMVNFEKKLIGVSQTCNVT